MVSNQLRDHGIVAWTKFNRRTKLDLLEATPAKVGVYVIRRSTQIQRMRGESDIVYVGSACNANGLRGRLRQYFSPGPTQQTNKRILALVADSEDFEVAWTVLPSEIDAVNLEKAILNDYCLDHSELPPQNRRG